MKNIDKYYLITLGLIITTAILGLIYIYDVITREPTKPINWSWEGIGMFISMCVGISWVLHGVQVKLLA